LKPIRTRKELFMRYAICFVASFMTIVSVGGFAADIRTDLDRLADELEPKVIEWRHDISSRFFVEDSAMKLGVRALLNLTVDYMESSQAR
jgi:hypothetical protein